MNIIGPLASGIIGAGNGSAQIFLRGTGSRAVYYSTFEGIQASTSGCDVALDANGSAVVYVNQLVDVVVKDSTGLTLRSFTVGEASPNVEVQSLSFTGAGYNTAIAATGQPTTLQSVLDLWLTNAGAPDWKVKVGTTTNTLQTWIASFAGIFYNVQAPAYGAKGDGSTDDTTAIQAAINAAQAAGGGIVLFPGTTTATSYRITSTLSLPEKVHLWGLGVQASGIAMDSPTASIITCTNVTGLTQEIRGILFFFAQASTGQILTNTNVGTVRSIKMVDCEMLGGSGSSAHVINLAAAAHRLLLENCLVVPGSSSSQGVSVPAVGPTIILNNCGFVAPATYASVLVKAGILHAVNCNFDCSLVAAGTYLAVQLIATPSNGSRGSIVGCDFIPGAGTSTAINSSSTQDSTAMFTETANVFRSGWTNLYSGLYSTTGGVLRLEGRKASAEAQTVGATTAITVHPELYGATVLTLTTNDNHTLTAPNPGAIGDTYTLVVFRDATGGTSSGTISFTGGGFAQVTPTFTVASTKTGYYQFRFMSTASGGTPGTLAWAPVAAEFATT